MAAAQQQLLTEEERHRLVAVLQELDPSAPAEKRQTPRRKVLVQTEIQLLVKDAPRSRERLSVTNVSRQGAAVLRPTRLEKGDKFVLHLEFGEGGGWLVLCEVRNCRRLASGMFKIGGQFMDRIEDPAGNSRVPGDWLAYAK